VVTRTQCISQPPEFEHAFGYATLISGVQVDRSPALRGPSNDLYRKLRVLDQAAVAAETLVRRGYQWSLMDTSYPGGRGVGGCFEVKIHRWIPSHLAGRPDISIVKKAPRKLQR